MISTIGLSKEIDSIRGQVIGLIYSIRDNSESLVLNYYEENQRVDTLKVTPLLGIQTSFNVPVGPDILMLFPEDKNFNQLLQNPYEYTEFIEQFREKVLVRKLAYKSN